MLMLNTFLYLDPLIQNHACGAPSEAVSHSSSGQENAWVNCCLLAGLSECLWGVHHFLIQFSIKHYHVPSQSSWNTLLWILCQSFHCRLGHHKHPIAGWCLPRGSSISSDLQHCHEHAQEQNWILKYCSHVHKLCVCVCVCVWCVCVFVGSY